MNERNSKIAVVVVGTIVTLGVIIWRTANALKEGSSAKPAWTFTVLSERAAPESYRAHDCYGVETVEGLAAEKLSVIEFRGTRKSIDRTRGQRQDLTVHKTGLMNFHSMSVPVLDADRI